MFSDLIGLGQRETQGCELSKPSTSFWLLVPRCSLQISFIYFQIEAMVICRLLSCFSFLPLCTLSICATQRAPLCPASLIWTLKVTPSLLCQCVEYVEEEEEGLCNCQIMTTEGGPACCVQILASSLSVPLTICMEFPKHFRFLRSPPPAAPTVR